MCDLRILYSDFKTSTPTKSKICSSDNIDCWDGGYCEPQSMACPPIPKFKNFFDPEGNVEKMSVNFPPKEQGAWEVEDGDKSISPSQQPSSVHDSRSDMERDLDFSYGGQWARVQQEEPPPSLSSPSPYLNFGISVFDHTDSQVLSNLIEKSFKSPKGKANNKSDNLSDELEVETMLKVKTAIRMRRGREDDERVKDILEQRVIHKKTKKELDDCRKAKINPNDFRKENLRVMVTNIRGFYSKKESLEAITVREEIDVICVSETFMSGNRFPELSGFTTFFRNRSTRGSGGVAVMIREEKAKYAVKVHTGPEENEFLVIKWTNCSPHLVMVIYYGHRGLQPVDRG